MRTVARKPRFRARLQQGVYQRCPGCYPTPETICPLKSKVQMWMQPLAADAPLEPVSTPVEEALGVKLKTYFDDLTSGPAPDGLMRLTEALDLAFERGDLGCCGRRSAARS